MLSRVVSSLVCWMTRNLLLTSVLTCRTAINLHRSSCSMRSTPLWTTPTSAKLLHSFGHTRRICRRSSSRWRKSFIVTPTRWLASALMWVFESLPFSLFPFLNNLFDWLDFNSLENVWSVRCWSWILLSSLHTSRMTYQINAETGNICAWLLFLFLNHGFWEKEKFCLPIFHRVFLINQALFGFKINFIRSNFSPFGFFLLHLLPVK